MHWVVQNDLFRERGYDHLLETLRRFSIPHTVVKIAPHLHRLLPEDFDSFAYKGELDDAPEAVIDDSGLVMVCGSVTLSKQAHLRGWKPGSFLNENFDYEVWSRTYGDAILNADATVTRFDAVPKRREFFIRPTLDDKSFAGKTMNWNRYVEWRDDVLAGKDASSAVTPETLVVTAAPKTIQAESRHYVVDGEIITSSVYKRAGRLFASRDVDEGALAFARERIRQWAPARGFVIDVALTEAGYRVVEIGVLNSAGLYDADVSRLVQAMDGMSI